MGLRDARYVAVGRGLRAAGLMLAIVASACTFNCFPEPKPTEPAVDANTAPSGVDQEAYSKLDAAGQACVILKWLQCPEGSPPDAECADTVRKLVEIGTFERTNLLCIRTSRTKERVRNCDVECQK